MRVLITGINGFAASHLARRLVNEGDEVHGTVRVRSDLHRIEDIKNQLKLHLMELTDPYSVSSVIKEVQPDEIYHLAAQSYVKTSWDSPINTYEVNVSGTIHILESIKESKIPILVTSTSEVYGEIEGAITEKTIPNPNTHYGISKYAQDMVARFYHQAFGVSVVVTRSGNVTGEARADVFVDSNFARQIVEIEKGKEPIIYRGNLESSRDFTDVEDITNGYIKALRSKKYGEVFCLGSGKLIKIQELLTTLVKLSDVKIETRIDPKRFRPIDTKASYVDALKAREMLNWEVTVPFEQSMENLLNYWRKRL